MTRFVVLGAGFIGSSIATRLGDRCHLLSVRQATRQHELPDSGTESNELRADVLIYAGGLAHPTMTAPELSSAVSASLRGLDVAASVAQRHEARTIFLISSGGAVYRSQPRATPATESNVASPRSAYGVLKLIEEHYLAQTAKAGQTVVALRCTNVYGGQQQPARRQGLIPVAIRKALAERPLELFAHPETQRDYLHVDDLAAAIARLTEVVSGLPEIINVGSGTATTTSEVLEIIGSQLGRAVTVHRRGEPSPPDSGAVSVDLLRGLIEWSPRSLPAGVADVIEEIKRGG